MRVLRDMLLLELGDAVSRGDDQVTERARGQVRELDELAALRGAEMEAVVARTQERIERRRLEVQATEMVELPDQPAQPGEGAPSGPSGHPRALSAARRGESARAGDHAGAGAAGP